MTAFLAAKAGIWQSDYHRVGGAGGRKETAISEPTYRRARMTKFGRVYSPSTLVYLCQISWPNSHRKTFKVKVAWDHPIQTAFSHWCGYPSNNCWATCNCCLTHSTSVFLQLPPDWVLCWNLSDNLQFIRIISTARRCQKLPQWLVAHVSPVQEWQIEHWPQLPLLLAIARW